MNILLFFSAQASPIKIAHNVRTDYLQKKPIVIEFRIENTASSPIQIPDLSYQTWRTSFVLESPTRKETRSNTKKEEKPVWVIPPHGARLLTMEIPGSDSLEPGTYSLTVQIDYEHDRYQQTQEISVQPPSIGHVDLTRSILGELSAIWTENNTNGTYHHFGSNFVYLHERTTNPKLVVHPNSSPYDFDVQHQDIYIRGKQKIHAVIPYSDAVPLSRMSLYKEQYHLPFWIPQSKKLMLLHINQQGVPSYRHVRSNTPRITKTSVTHTAQGTPLYLFHHQDGIELLKVEPPEKTHWPLNSQYLYKKTSAEKILFSEFDLDVHKGILAVLITKESESFYRIWVSLSGTVVHKEELPTLPNAEVIDVYQSAILMTNQTELILIHDQTQRRYPTSEHCKLNKNGLFCFQDGSWLMLSKYPTPEP